MVHRILNPALTVPDSVPRYLGAAQARPVTDGNFHYLESLLKCFDLHFHRPAVGSILHVEPGKRLPANGPKGSQVGVGVAVNQSNDGGRQPVAEPLLRGQGTRFRASPRPGAQHQVRLVFLQGPEQVFRPSRVVTVIAVQK